ncbi:MAG TPA: HDIG domain-containing protein, partial [Chthonomonadaceae bacterium]|nr:HDIG domain-containing protein [Chthonomonadaceae bacterium]
MNRSPLLLLRRRPGRNENHKARIGKRVLPVDGAKVGLLILTVAALSALMTINLLPDKISLRLGDVSPREVRAGRSVVYISTTETARLQQAAMQATPPVYDTDESAATGASRTVQDLFDRIEGQRQYLSHTPRPASISQTVAALQPQFGAFFTSAQLRYLLTIPAPVLQNLRVTTARLVSAEMDRDIRDNSTDLERAHKEVAEAARREVASSQGAATVRAVASQALRPTRLLDRRKTQAAREAAARAVPPISYRITRGDEIIGPGETVTQEHLDKFTALGLLNPHLDMTTGATVCILAAAMVLLVVLFIARTLPALYRDRRRLALLAVIVLLSVFGLKVGATMLGLSFGSGQPGYLGMMSVVAAGMLVSVLLDAHLAVLIVALLAVQSGLIMNHEIRFTVMALMSSLVGILCIGSGRARHNLLKTTLALAGANLAMVWLLGLLLRDSLAELGTGSAWAIGSAVFAAFLFWFGLLALEKPFGILTHTALLELSATDQPLLQQLCALAPGTYAHSMLVGTLAEAGARAIGADPLLCRVGGYYHDIG